jgi:hypothetical protein
MRIGAWVAVGGSAALLGMGIAGAVINQQKINDYSKNPRCFGTADPTQECANIRQSADQGRALAIGGFVAGGALAATSAVLFWISRSPRQGPSAGAVLNCGPGPGSVGVSCAHRF